MRALVLLSLLCSACSVTGAVADALSAQGDTFGSDDDPELIRDAAPAGLKVMESVLASEPDHDGLLLALCRGYAQYAYAFVEEDMEIAAEDDPRRVPALRERARRMWMRAHVFCRRGLQARHQSWTPEALGGLNSEDAPLVYWTAATWAGAVAVSKDPALLADLDKVEALAMRAVELDGEYNGGAPHGLVGALLAAKPGGDLGRARAALEKAAELSGGQKMLPLLSLANLAIKLRDKQLFEKTVETVLGFDTDSAPASRLENLIAQRRARRLQATAADLFVDEGESGS